MATPSHPTKLAVIGGSGLYDMEALEHPNWVDVETPWGAPSDRMLSGVLAGIDVVFLPRHGRGHRHTPSSIPYRANIDGLKRLGVTDVVSLSAVGSFREHMAPGDFVVIDQFIDRTFAREKSFFGPGCVAHVSMMQPTCGQLSGLCAQAARAVGVSAHEGGCYLAMEGPQFSTLAESRLYRENWGCDVIGMTNMPEAKLAREAELCYASVAMVTDYDSWHPDHGEVDVRKIIETLTGNAAKGRALVQDLAQRIGNAGSPCSCGCRHALDYAIITAPEARDAQLVQKLDAVAGRVL